MATVRLKFDLIKGKRVPWMRIEKPDSIVSIHVYRPLEVAVETATVNLMDWLITDYGFTPADATAWLAPVRISASTCTDVQDRQA